MTRKDYELIAGAIHAELTAGNLELASYAQVCHSIADAMRKDNARFNKAIFLNACGWVEAYGYEYED
jgi:hypothetical protein